MNKEDIQAAAVALVNAVRESSGQASRTLERLPTDEDRIMYAAAYAVGAGEVNSEVTMALDRETDWLQDAYETGRSDYRA